MTTGASSSSSSATKTAGTCSRPIRSSAPALTISVSRTTHDHPHLDGVCLDPDTASDAARAWLATRGLTFEDVAAAHADPDAAHFRAQPDGYGERLRELSVAGLRESHPSDPQPVDQG